MVPICVLAPWGGVRGLDRQRGVVRVDSEKLLREDALALVRAAQESSRDAGAEVVEPWQLLLEMFRLRGSVVEIALGFANLNEEAFRAALSEALAAEEEPLPNDGVYRMFNVGGGPPPPPAGEPRVSPLPIPMLGTLVTVALGEAAWVGDTPVGPEHLLLALADGGGRVTATALARCRTNPMRLREAVFRAMILAGRQGREAKRA